MTQHQVSVPTTTPSRFLTVVEVLLMTPGLQRLLGRSLMLITFTGRRTGHRYTTPVSYARRGDHVFALTKTFRHWWKNFATHPEVEVRLAGRVTAGRATASVGEESSFERVRAYLAVRPIDARVYGGSDRRRPTGGRRRAGPASHVVLIDIIVSGWEGRVSPLPQVGR